MDRLGGRTVGLTVESQSIRLVGLRGRSVDLWAELPIDPSWVRDGEVRDAAQVGLLLGQTFREKGLTRYRLVAAVGGLHARARILSFSTEEIAGGVEVEARRLLSADAGVSIHWQTIDRDGDRQRLFVLATPEGPIRSIVETLRIAGLRPAAIDSKPLALYRAANLRDGVIAALDGTALDLVIVVDDLPVFIRSTAIGVGTDDLLGRTADELARAIRFYADTQRSAPLEPAAPVILAGDLPTDPAFVANVEALCGHSVEPPRLAIGAPEEFPAGRYLAALGLCLKR